MIPVQVKRGVVAVVRVAHRRLTRDLQRLTPEQHPRTWSNQQIARAGANVTGDVVHVSAWRDEDKAGRTYREYFPAARSYVTTNVGGERGEGLEGAIHLDLTQPLAAESEQTFDFVLNHTTLEHIYEVDVAIRNLFSMSRSDLFLIVPFMQVEHWEAPSFGDYWRIGAHALYQACITAGFEPLSLTSNHNPVWPIYYCLHARRVADVASLPGDLWSVTGARPGFESRPVEVGHTLMGPRPTANGAEVARTWRFVDVRSPVLPDVAAP